MPKDPLNNGRAPFSKRPIRGIIGVTLTEIAKRSFRDEPASAASHRQRPGRAGAGRVLGPHLHAVIAGPGRLAATAGPPGPGEAAAGLVHRRVVLGYRVR